MTIAVQKQENATMRGVVSFVDHEIQCIIGLLPHERREKQYIFVDLEAEVDVTKSSMTDDVRDVVSYVSLADVCTQVAVSGCYKLMEAYAKAVTDRIFESYPVSWIKIKVRKPRAIPTARYAAVEIKRERPTDLL